MGAIGLRARVWPSAVGSLVWQVVQEGVSILPVVCWARKNCRPRSAEKPAKLGSVCLAAAARFARIAGRPPAPSAAPVRQRAMTAIAALFPHIPRQPSTVVLDFRKAPPALDDHGASLPKRFLKSNGRPRHPVPRRPHRVPRGLAESGLCVRSVPAAMGVTPRGRPAARRDARSFGRSARPQAGRQSRPAARNEPRGISVDLSSSIRSVAASSLSCGCRTLRPAV
jgi:hypothetical protein